MKDPHHLLFQIAEVQAQNPKSEAVLACLDLFRTLSQRRKEFFTYVEASQPIDK